MKKNKGFTLVELLVVIAILAILTTVTIIGYSGFIKKANISNDKTLVAQLNGYLKAADRNTDIDTTSAVSDLLKVENVDIASLKTETEGYRFGYDVINHKFCLIDDDYNLVDYLTNKIDVFAFVINNDELSKAEAKGYSAYLLKDYDAVKQTIDTKEYDVVTSKGVDVGDNANIKVLYKNTTNMQNVLITTNGGELTIKAFVNTSTNESDTISHYNKLDKLFVITNGTSSYHEYGSVNYAEVDSGRVVAENDSIIEKVIVTNTDAYAQEKGTGIIVYAVATSQEVKNASLDNTSAIDGNKKELTYVDYLQGKSDIKDYLQNVSSIINDKAYIDLQSAINEASNGQTIKLLNDIDTNHGYLFSSDINVTLDLANHTLKVTGSNGNDGGRAIKVTKGTLTIINGVIDGRSTSANPSSSGPWSSTRTGGCLRLSGGNAKVENVVMYNNDGWGNAVKMESNNTLEMRDCEIHSTYGAGLEIGEGTADLYNCSLTQDGLANNAYMSTCIAVCNFGSINLHHVDAKMDLPEENVNADGTYVLYVYNSGGRITVDGGTFVSNSKEVVHVDASTLSAYCVENCKVGNESIYRNKAESVIRELNTDEAKSLIAAYDALKANFGGKTSILTINGGSFTGNMYITPSGEGKDLANIVINAGEFTSIPDQTNIIDNRTK